MKKLYTLLVLAIAFTSNAQVANGDLETWTNPTTASNFTPVTSGTFSANNFLSQESVIKHGGSFSASHTSQAGTQAFEAALIPVVVGTSYTMKYWYLDNDVNARARNWSTWVTQTGTTVTAINVDDATLHSDYSVDSGTWKEISVTATAPAGATHFRFQVRTYKDAAAGGKMYFDDLTFTSANVATNQFQITGLKVFVSNKNLNVTSDNNELKSVAIYNILGKQVINTTTSGNPINVSELSSGIYIVKVSENGKSSTLKVVIQ